MESTNTSRIMAGQDSEQQNIASSTSMTIDSHVENPKSDAKPPRKQMNKRSNVWEHFTAEYIRPGETRARCNDCKKSFAYISDTTIAGTSHLKRHIASEACKNNQLDLHSPLSTGSTPTPLDKLNKRYRSSTKFSKTNQKQCQNGIATMIIGHNYPLHIVEHPGFINFVRTLQPLFEMANFSSIQEDCLAIYQREKKRIMEIISGIPGGVNLSLDLWSSTFGNDYVLIIGHFTDHDWKLQRRILNVIIVPYLNSDDVYSDALMDCVNQWNLKGKLFTLMLDNSFNEVVLLEKTRGLVSLKKPHMLNGQLIRAKCFAQVLSSLAQDALEVVNEIVKKIRILVKYVKASDACEEKINVIKQQLEVPSTKNLCVDEITKWDTTYSMLVAAVELKDIFYSFNTFGLLVPSIEEWKQVEIICNLLKTFHKAADILSSPMYSTSNVFLNKAWEVKWELMEAAESDDVFLRNMAIPILSKFDNYWNESCLRLAIAVVMDPRYKMKYVEFVFGKNYNEDAHLWIKAVDDGVHELYMEYSLLPLPIPSMSSHTNEEGTSLSPKDGVPFVGASNHEVSGDSTIKSELDQYLEESLLPRVQEFDILGWWKIKRPRYPLLSRMAADILSIPNSKVDPEDVFNIGDKAFDSYHSSLEHETLEALVCSKYWLSYV